MACSESAACRWVEEASCRNYYRVCAKAIAAGPVAARHFVSSMSGHDPRIMLRCFLMLSLASYPVYTTAALVFELFIWKYDAVEVAAYCVFSDKNKTMSFS